MVVAVGTVAKLQRCRHCGRCCRAEVCYLGQGFMGQQEQGPCRALYRSGNEYLCGLMTDCRLYIPHLTLSSGQAAMFQEAIQNMLGSGMGCDCTLPGV